MTETESAEAPTDPAGGFVGVTGGASAGVTYRVTSNGSRALITYTESGSIEQASGAVVPWSKTVDPGSLAQVSAQDSDGTTITCTIISSSGTVLSKHTATGAYAITSCQS